MSDRKCYVYRCLSDDGEIIYIGMAYDVDARMAQHKGSFWYRDMVSVDRQICGSRRDAAGLEKHLIKMHKPRGNVALAYDGDKSEYFMRLGMSEEMRQRIERWRFAQFEETGKTPSFSEACRALIDKGLNDE